MVSLISAPVFAWSEKRVSGLAFCSSAGIGRTPAPRRQHVGQFPQSDGHLSHLPKRIGECARQRVDGRMPSIAATCVAGCPVARGSHHSVSHHCQRRPWPSPRHKTRSQNPKPRRPPLEAEQRPQSGSAPFRMEGARGSPLPRVRAADGRSQQLEAKSLGRQQATESRFSQRNKKPNNRGERRGVPEY